MRLITAVNQYIAYCRSLGEHFKSNDKMLNAFVHAIGKRTALIDVDPESIGKYLAGTTPIITRYWHNKYWVLRGFYRYAISRGYTAISPLPVVTPKRPPPFIPYIYKVEELRALFDACFDYQKNKGRFDPYMLRTLLLLLYGAGLRISEAIALTLADVDLSQAVLTIRETKFYKTRLVPLGKYLAESLLEYVQWRRKAKYPQNLDAPFFIGRNEKAVNQRTVEYAFQIIREKVGIRRDDNPHHQPRLHDLRHTFAVHRLTAWYKEGADVQRLLPVLSVYLGHSCLSSTSIYLTMTPALLEEASHRFEQYALKKEIFHD